MWEEKHFLIAMRENSAGKVDWDPWLTFSVSMNCIGQPWIWNVIPVFVRTWYIHSFVPLSVLYPFILFCFSCVDQFSMLWSLLKFKGLLCALTFKTLIQIFRFRYLVLTFSTLNWSFCIAWEFFFFLNPAPACDSSEHGFGDMGRVFRTLMIDIIKEVKIPWQGLP